MNPSIEAIAAGKQLGNIEKWSAQWKTQCEGQPFGRLLVPPNRSDIGKPLAPNLSLPTIEDDFTDVSLSDTTSSWAWLHVSANGGGFCGDRSSSQGSIGSRKYGGNQAINGQMVSVGF